MNKNAYFSKLLACCQNTLSCYSLLSYLCNCLLQLCTLTLEGWSMADRPPFSSACYNSNIRNPTDFQHDPPLEDRRLQIVRTWYQIWMLSSFFVTSSFSHPSWSPEIVFRHNFQWVFSLATVYPTNVLRWTVHWMFIYKGLSRTPQNQSR